MGSSCSSCCKKTKEPSDDELGTFAPIEQRECRDVVFLIIFLAFIGGLGVVAYLGINHGNPYRLIYGVDSYGNTCGQKNDPIPNVTLSGRDLSNKKKVFFFDPNYFTSLIPKNPLPSFTAEETKIICIEKCPDREVGVTEFMTTENVSLCLYNVQSYVNDIRKCPATPVQKHTSILNRCIPQSILDTLNMTAKVLQSQSGLGKAYLGGDVPRKILSDVQNTYIEIGYMMAIAVGVALLVVILMRFLACVIVWTLVFFIIISGLAASTYCWYSWYSLVEEYNSMEERFQTTEAKDYVRTWLVYAAVISGVTVIMTLIFVALRKRISLVVQLFKEAGKALGSMPCLLLQPIWTLIALFVLLAGMGVIAAFIETSGLPEVQPNGHVELVLEKYWKYLRWYNIFAMLWISSFVVACQDMIVAGAVAIWFFKRDKRCLKIGSPVVKSIGRLLRYHLGSIAFGSFIIALVMLARIILAYIQKRLQGKTSKVVDFIMKVLQCCLWCFERFLKYLNRNAYIEIAIYGYNFCRSAQKATLLIVANALRMAAINSIGDFVLFLGKLSTVAVVLVVGNELFFKNRNDINYSWVPLGVSCAFAFAIAHCFLLIYEITIDTIFLCFCEDCERNDGSASRPYFMSKNLMTYLDKTNQAGSSKKTEQKKDQQTKL